MKMIISLISMVMLLLSCNQAQDIDAYLSRLHEKGQLNGNVLVMQNDTVLYEKSFGYADGARNHLLTPEHHFAIGSIYKEFPGVAIMQLKEAGLLTPDDTLSLFMPHLPAWADKITIRNLLQYSSGLPRIKWDSYFENNQVAREDEIVQNLSDLKKLEFQPGTDYLYSNYNPFLLMRIVEIVSEQSFQDYVEQKLLRPFEIEGIVIKESYPYRDTSLMAIPFNGKFEVDDYEVEVTTICSSARGM
ncbi:serine hydrolase domain-containing protein [Nafulsella turpanensis]|uniref:serine hydrolase domain-containing protein n=1 Tax=Nafulsella turpanensis TaxID=1265690 RepID=UPI000345FCA1|nr:serine hydrolase domain-containing protein [Nafulsella turpanensis]